MIWCCGEGPSYPAAIASPELAPPNEGSIKAVRATPAHEAAMAATGLQLVAT
jgi:hypothetical protein